MTFRDKLVFITGASSGIGAQAARDFAAQGANLILVARRQERLQKLAEEIRTPGREILIYPLDLADSLQRQVGVEDWLAHQLLPDILINNAGYGNYRPFLQEKPDDLERMMSVNFQAAAHLLYAFLPGMIQRKSGAIVNVASGASQVAVAYMASYCATKFALRALTESIAYELRGTGVTIHLVNPGSVETEFFDAGIWQGPRQQKKATASQVSQALQQAILKNRLTTYVPPSRRYMVYLFNLLGPLGRWVMQRRARLY